jgi:hypothetical protein
MEDQQAWRSLSFRPGDLRRCALNGLQFASLHPARSRVIQRSAKRVEPA